ncbi:MAG: hypothetical protein ACE5M4_08145 [Anaerolineales bacterium]
MGTRLKLVFAEGDIQAGGVRIDLSGASGASDVTYVGSGSLGDMETRGASSIRSGE